MKKMTAALSMAVAMSIAVLSPAPAKAGVETNESEDITGFTVFVPCADGGIGEDVVFAGNLHILLTTTLDQNGGFHAKTHFQPQGLQGVGLSTGDKYQATGGTQDQFNGVVGETYTYVNNFRIIGQGRGNNYLIHEVFHVTVNANGEAVVQHDNFSAECK